MLFEILPALVYQLAEPGLTQLPVEMIARILRLLDPESLLNVAKTYKVCKEVTLGDPILRRKLRTLLKEKKKLETERRINPALGVTVTREEPAKMFGKNLKKKVAVYASRNTESFTDVETKFLQYPKRKNKCDIATIATQKCNYRL